MASKVHEKLRKMFPCLLSKQLIILTDQQDYFVSYLGPDSVLNINTHLCISAIDKFVKKNDMMNGMLSFFENPYFSYYII